MEIDSLERKRGRKRKFHSNKIDFIHMEFGKTQVKKVNAKKCILEELEIIQFLFTARERPLNMAGRSNLSLCQPVSALI